MVFEYRLHGAGLDKGSLIVLRFLKIEDLVMFQITFLGINFQGYSFKAIHNLRKLSSLKDIFCFQEITAKVNSKRVILIC